MSRWLITMSILTAVRLASADDKSDAKKRFDEGRALLKAGDWGAACERFEKSFQLEPAGGTALNLGECAERAGEVRFALDLYRFAQESYERAGEPVKALFAREHATRVLAFHPGLMVPAPPPAVEPTPDPEAPAAPPVTPVVPPAPPPAESTWSYRNELLLAGGVTLGVSLVAGVVWLSGYDTGFLTLLTGVGGTALLVSGLVISTAPAGVARRGARTRLAIAPVVSPTVAGAAMQLTW